MIRTAGDRDHEIAWRDVFQRLRSVRRRRGGPVITGRAVALDAVVLQRDEHTGATGYHWWLLKNAPVREGDRLGFGRGTEGQAARGRRITVCRT